MEVGIMSSGRDRQSLVEAGTSRDLRTLHNWRQSPPEGFVQLLFNPMPHRVEHWVEPWVEHREILTRSVRGTLGAIWALPFDPLSGAHQKRSQPRWRWPWAAGAEYVGSSYQRTGGL